MLSLTKSLWKSPNISRCLVLISSQKDKHETAINLFSVFFLAAADSLFNPPPSRPRTKETFRHPPGRTQGASKDEGGSEGEGERPGRNAGREGKQQPGYHVTRDRVSQQASLPQWTTPVHAEATAGKCTHTQVGQWTHTHKQY